MIRFDKVSFTYQESLQNGGLRDVDLTINKGECVLLCGRSGCGKTTLTRLVNGLIPYFYPGEVTGTTYVDGKNIQDYPIYEVSEYVGSVFQNPRSQFFNVDTDSEISFGMENLTYPREKMKERISKTVADLDTVFFRRSAFSSATHSNAEKRRRRRFVSYSSSPSAAYCSATSRRISALALSSSIGCCSRALSSVSCVLECVAGVGLR